MKLSMPMLGKSKKQGSGAFEDPPPLGSPTEVKAGKEEKAGKSGFMSKITSRTKKTKAGAVENGGAAPALPVPKSQEELKSAFKVYDVDSDGRISSAELSKILTSLGGEISDGEVQELMKQIDTDNDGFISVEEFIAFHQTASGSGALSSVHDPMRDAFQMFDKDGDNRISASELQSVLVSLGDKGHSLDECKQMIKSVDKNGDGHVDFEEFQLLMGGQ